MVDSDGQLLGRYDKMHLVMFGEYIPLGAWLAWLGDAFGFSSADAGREPRCFFVHGARVAPNICFESMMARVISHAVRRLTSQGSSPDLLINVTNDSWFRGSSILDHHLACSIVAAVENRRPMLVAANSGISAEIDGCGRVLQRLERFEEAGIWARPRRDSRLGLVQIAGYPLAWFCAVIAAISVIPLRLRDRRRQAAARA
jgi:apolipoprotein N-acyltransferase